MAFVLTPEESGESDRNSFQRLIKKKVASLIGRNNNEVASSGIVLHH